MDSRTIYRRNIFRSALALGAGLFAAKAVSTTEAAAAPDGVPKAAYHLTDPEKVVFALGSIHNHIEGMGGPDKVRLALVVHGPALKLLHADTSNMDIKGRVTEARAARVELFACRFAMEAQKLKLGDLLPGFQLAEKGGVVKLAELQAQGYAYLRP